MKIPRVKGKRREARRDLAKKSIEVLEIYRHGQDAKEDCPLKQALEKDHNF